jgi:ethanolamine utilization protein EutP
MEGKRNRVILIGCSMAGKTTLSQFIHQEELKYHKTQTIQLIYDDTIDTPGEYLERTNLRGAITVTAVEASIIALVQPAVGGQRMFPPGYASTFAKPCIGIITKSDLADEQQIAEIGSYLKEAGAGTIFVTSSYNGTGFDELIKYFRVEEQASRERVDINASHNCR